VNDSDYARFWMLYSSWYTFRTLHAFRAPRMQRCVAQQALAGGLERVAIRRFDQHDEVGQHDHASAWLSALPAVG
jgi:hypothetical protein